MNCHVTTDRLGMLQHRIVMLYERNLSTCSELPCWRKGIVMLYQRELLEIHMLQMQNLPPGCDFEEVKGQNRFRHSLRLPSRANILCFSLNRPLRRVHWSEQVYHCTYHMRCVEIRVRDRMHHRAFPEENLAQETSVSQASRKPCRCPNIYKMIIEIGGLISILH